MFRETKKEMHQSTNHIFYKLAVKAIEELITIYCNVENKRIFTHLMKNKSSSLFFNPLPFCRPFSTQLSRRGIWAVIFTGIPSELMA